MPKRKRSSTWYRQLNREKQSVYQRIYGQDATFLNQVNTEGLTRGLTNAKNNNSTSLNDYSKPISEAQLEESAGKNLSPCSSSSIHSNFYNSSSSDFNISIDSIANVSNENHIGFISCNARSSDSNNTDSTTVEKLKEWCVSHKITASAVKDLLNILRCARTSDLQNLPKDPRTFLGTPKSTLIRIVPPGEYYHFGIKNSISNLYASHNQIALEETISIAINIDGLPLAKSSSSQVYPILGINRNMQHKNVFMIGVYHGYDKPNNFNDFLSEFVTEAKDLVTNGILLFGKLYNFKITMFLFDAVAKASVLYVKGHSGYESCTKCTQEGEHVNDRICFPELIFTKRTHESFVTQVHPDHHTGQSILLELPSINIISDIPLDYMHLVLLGVVRKLLVGVWCQGRPPHKLSNSVIVSISQALENLGKFIPKEFSRRPRSLKEVRRWKATEYRQFLLYTSPVVLKKKLPKQKYQHFLTLSVAIRILLSDTYCADFCDYAETLLSFFVKTTKDFYGVHMLTHNFHNLLHLVDDVRIHGTLENFSNFSSENFLQHVKSFIRKPEKPLQQIIRRYHEFVKNKTHFVMHNLEFTFSGLHYDGTLIEGCVGPQYKTLLKENVEYSSSIRDGCCTLKDGSIIEIKNFAFCPQQNQQVVIGQKYVNKDEFFNIPCCSSIFGIYSVSDLSNLRVWPVSEIATKLVRLPYEDMPWFVVKFLQSDEVEAVPACWLKNKEKGVLFWPPFTNKTEIERAIRNEDIPCDDWSEFSVKLLSHRPYDTFITANAKASKGCTTSDLEPVLPEKRVSKKKIYASSSGEDDCEDTDGGDLNAPKPCNTVTRKSASNKNIKLLQKQPRRLELCENDLEGIDYLSSRSATPQSSTTSDNYQRQQNIHEAFEKNCIDLIVKQKMQIKELDRSIMDLHKKVDMILLLVETAAQNNAEEGGRSTIQTLNKEIFRSLPIVDEETLQMVESHLHTDDHFNCLVDNLYRIGGQGYKDCARRFLRTCVQDSFAATYSLHGHKRKKIFKTTKLFSVIATATQKCDIEASLKNIELAVGQWLAKAPERLKKNETLPQPIQEVVN